MGNSAASAATSPALSGPSYSRIRDTAPPESSFAVTVSSLNSRSVSLASITAMSPVSWKDSLPGPVDIGDDAVGGVPGEDDVGVRVRFDRRGEARGHRPEFHPSVEAVQAAIFRGVAEVDDLHIAIESIDRGGAERGRCRGRGRSGALRQVTRDARDGRSAPRRGRSSRPRRSARSPPTTPRSPPTSTRSRATRSHGVSRSSSRRSTTCATARTRTSARRSTARRRTAAGRSPTRPGCRASMPSFNNLLDLDAAYRIARDYTAPTVAIVKHTDPVGLASHDELVEAYRHALETDPVASFGGIVGVNRELDGATAREIAANSYEAVVAPASASRRSGSCAPSPASSCWPSRRPDRGHARLRHRQPRLQARRRRAARREPRRPRARSRPAPGRDPATADPRGADRPALRLARGPPRPVERHRPRPQRRDGRDRGRRRPAARCRSRSPLRRAGDRASSRSWRPTPTSRSPTGSRPRPGRRHRDHPAGGSIRDEMAIEVADRHHLAMVFTGRRHFRH